MPVYKSNTPTADGRCWLFQASYKTAEGKYKNYRSKLYATKKEALEEQAKWILAHKGGADSLLTFRKLIPEFLADKKATVKPQTYDREVVLCNHVQRFIGGLVIAKMNASQFENFRSAVLAENWSVSYKNKMLKQVRSLCEYASRKHNIVNNIPKQYKNFTDPNPPKPMQIFTLAEFDRFIPEVENERMAAFFTFLMFTGARMNEANALTWNDIDLEKATAHITKSIVMKTKTKDGLFAVTTPKTPSSIRYIPIPKRALNRLKTLHAEDSLPDDFVFGGKRPLAETSITKAKDQAIKKAALHRIRVHDFRHSFTSMLVNNLGVDNILLVSRLLGHASVQETLKTYSHLWNGEIERLTEKLNNL